jgi:hypothetical protein
MTRIAAKHVLDLLQFDPYCCHAVFYILKALPPLLYLILQALSSIIRLADVFRHIALKLNKLTGQLTE